MPAKDTHAPAQPQLPKPNLRHEGEEGAWLAGCGGVAPHSSIFPNNFQERWLGDKAQGINKLNAVIKSHRVMVGGWVSPRHHCRPVLVSRSCKKAPTQK